jgi:hypothetical protein
VGWQKFAERLFNSHTSNERINIASNFGLVLSTIYFQGMAVGRHLPGGCLKLPTIWIANERIKRAPKFD